MACRFALGADRKDVTIALCGHNRRRFRKDISGESHTRDFADRGRFSAAHSLQLCNCVCKFVSTVCSVCVHGLREVQLLASGNNFVHLLTAMAIVLVGTIYESGTHHKSECDQYRGVSMLHKN